MARNIEIKARVRDLEALVDAAATLETEGSFALEQEDTFFHAAQGRLKLRELGSGEAELIQYERPDATGPSESRYIRVATEDPEALKEALSRALGIRGVVRKQRRVYLAGATRIHVDRVEGLGDFLELEVVLTPQQSHEEGAAIARDLMERLGIQEADLLEEAYIDMLTFSAKAPPEWACDPSPLWDRGPRGSGVESGS